MMRTAVSVLTMLLWFTPQQTNAFSGNKCTIKNAYQLDGGGMAPDKLAYDQVGGEFVVDRATGKMHGQITSAGWPDRHEVLDMGSNQQSYKAIYISPPDFSVWLLIIQGSQQGPAKDFMLTHDLGVYTGTCTQLQ